MINVLGKSLVVCHSVLSIMAMSWAAALYLDFMDWGWVTPRKEVELSVPSEYDKSVAAVEQAKAARDAALPAVKPAQARLEETELAFARNHLVYVAELKRLQSAADTIEVKTFQEPGLPLDTPGKDIGKPVFEGKVDGLVKSIRGYEADLEKLLGKSDPKNKDKRITEGEIGKVTEEIRKLNEHIAELTQTLTGKDAQGKHFTFGIYDLIEGEYQAQKAAKDELAEVKPRWAAALEEARLFALRRTTLQDALRRLENPQARRGSGK